MVVGQLLVPGRPTIWMIVGQRPVALAVDAGGGLFKRFTLLYSVPSSFSLSLGVARYKLKYCLKGSFYPKQPNDELV